MSTKRLKGKTRRSLVNILAKQTPIPCACMSMRRDPIKQNEWQQRNFFIAAASSHSIRTWTCNSKLLSLRRRWGSWWSSLSATETSRYHIKPASRSTRWGLFLGWRSGHALFQIRAIISRRFSVLFITVIVIRLITGHGARWVREGANHIALTNGACSSSSS